MLPSAEGRKTTFRLADCPGSKLRGKAAPLKLKLPAVTVAPEIVEFWSAAFVTVTTWVLLVPTVTFSKSTVLTLASRWFPLASEGPQEQEKQVSRARTSALLAALKEPQLQLCLPPRPMVKSLEGIRPERNCFEGRFLDMDPPFGWPLKVAIERKANRG